VEFQVCKLSYLSLSLVYKVPRLRYQSVDLDRFRSGFSLTALGVLAAG